MTASVSRPASTASTPSRCPGRSGRSPRPRRARSIAAGRPAIAPPYRAPERPNPRRTLAPDCDQALRHAQDALTVDLGLREEPLQILRAQQRDRVPVTLSLPSEGEPAVEGPARALRQKMEERHQVVRLDREIAIRRRHEVALRDASYLACERRPGAGKHVLDDGVRERHVELAV